MQDLTDELKDSIKKFSNDAFNLAHKNNTKIKTIVIQYNKNKIYIGKDHRGTFQASYYDPDLPNQDHDAEQLVNNNKKVVDDCKDYIDDMYQGNKMTSFNIFYSKNGNINVCRNQIGNKSIEKSRLFNEFNFFM